MVGKDEASDLGNVCITSFLENIGGVVKIEVEWSFFGLCEKVEKNLMYVWEMMTILEFYGS